MATPTSLTFDILLNQKKNCEYESCYLSTLCLPNVLRVTNCDIAILCEHKLKQSSLSHMNSIDTRYHSVSKTDRLKYFVNCAHDKCGATIMYISSLQYGCFESCQFRPLSVFFLS